MEEDKSSYLRWYEDDYENERHFAESPVFTDGTYLYVISRKKYFDDEEEEEEFPSFVLEWYDIANKFSKVNGVELTKKNKDEKFVK